MQTEMAHKDPMIQVILKADHLSEETRLGFRSSVQTVCTVQSPAVP